MTLQTLRRHSLHDVTIFTTSQPSRRNSLQNVTTTSQPPRHHNPYDVTTSTSQPPRHHNPYDVTNFTTSQSPRHHNLPNITTSLTSQSLWRHNFHIITLMTSYLAKKPAHNPLIHGAPQNTKETWMGVDDELQPIVLHARACGCQTRGRPVPSCHLACHG